MIEHRGQAENKSLKGQLMLVAAFLTCPCHLIIVVPLLVASGSALGLFLDRHFIFMLIVFSGAFIASLTLGMKCLGNSGLDS